MIEDDGEFGTADSPSTHRRSLADTPRFRNSDQRPGSHAARGPARNGQTERIAALVDARFWWWLHDGDTPSGAALEAAHAELQQIAHGQGLRLVRTLWYTDQDGPGGAAPAGLLVRRVPSNAQDRGVTMLRAMAQDLAAMAAHRGVDRVLLVSDDDRLLLAVDDAQRRGLSVDMLVDENAQDLHALQEEDPNWASLLASGDRLVVLGPQAGSEQGRAARMPPAGVDAHALPHGNRPRREAPSAEASGIIEDEILRWWDEETDDQRAHWRREVQASRGIPQELDRQLLLRISRRLGQALSPAEKSAMRQLVRHQLLETSEDPPAGDAAAAAGAGVAGAPTATTWPADA